MTEAKEYAVTVAVVAEPHHAAKLRTILRDVLELGGYEVTAGVSVIERWLVDATARLHTQDKMRGPGTEAEHHRHD